MQRLYTETTVLPLQFVYQAFYRRHRYSALMDRQESLLLVEDDPRLRRLLERILRNAGHQVTSAETGAQMMEHCAAEQFNLLILDRMLPDGDSVLLAQNLRQQSNIPIIMLTGKSDPSDKVLGLEVGADDYITKPFDESEFLARVRSVLRRARSASTDIPDTQRTEILDIENVVRFLMQLVVRG